MPYASCPMTTVTAQCAVRLALVSLVAVALASGRAEAAPRADLVVLWMPGVDVAPLGEVAREAGAAVVDRTPAVEAPPPAAAALRRGIEAYESLRIDEAWAALSEARTLGDRAGGADLTAAMLSDLALYRGLTQIQRGDPTAAWDELVAALVIAPTRVLDPARFPPGVIAEVERARAAVLARPRVELALVRPADCSVIVDGAAVDGAAVAVVAGTHWIHARCGAATWSARADALDAVTRIAIEPRGAAPPGDDDVLIQARAAGARGVVIATAQGGVVTLRRLAIDGRERDRRTTAAAPDGVAAARALETLLASAPPARWYQSRWAWAAGAAILAAAVLVPITAALAADGAPPSVTVRGPASLP